MLIFSLTVTLSMTPVFSLPEQANSKAKEMTVVSIPTNAKKIGEGVYDLGYKVHDGKILQGTLYVFSDKEFAKPADAGNGGKGGGGGTTSTCYSYITSGAKWRSEEPWGVSTVNAPVAGVTGILQTAVSQWEDADSPANYIMGEFDSSMIVDANSIGVSMNDKNEVAFGDITDEGVIAATWVWRTTAGPPSQRYIAEWDQLYDVVSFNWSSVSTGDPDSMDFANIATHEIGHAVGMGHPSSTCNLETMYAYASNGEIIKRDLHDGDIVGVNRLY